MTPEEKAVIEAAECWAANFEKPDYMDSVSRRLYAQVERLRWSRKRWHVIDSGDLGSGHWRWAVTGDRDKPICYAVDEASARHIVGLLNEKEPH